MICWKKKSDQNLIKSQDHQVIAPKLLNSHRSINALKMFFKGRNKKLQTYSEFYILLLIMQLACNCLIFHYKNAYYLITTLIGLWWYTNSTAALAFGQAHFIKRHFAKVLTYFTQRKKKQVQLLQINIEPPTLISSISSVSFMNRAKVLPDENLVVIFRMAISEFWHAFFMKSKPYCLAFFSRNMHLNIIGTNKIARAAQAEKVDLVPQANTSTLRV